MRYYVEVRTKRSSGCIILYRLGPMPVLAANSEAYIMASDLLSEMDTLRWDSDQGWYVNDSGEWTNIRVQTYGEKAQVTAGLFYDFLGDNDNDRP